MAQCSLQRAIPMDPVRRILTLPILVRRLMPLLLVGVLMLGGCRERKDYTAISALSHSPIGVQSGTIVDQLVLRRLPEARILYFQSPSDAALALESGKVDAVADDLPVLMSIAATHEGFLVLPETIYADTCGLGVRKGEVALKESIDRMLQRNRLEGKHAEMLMRWFPESGPPGPMPTPPSPGMDGALPVLRLGTAAACEPFSYIDGTGRIVGYDIELAQELARSLGCRLEVVNMEFSALIPALRSGKVDIIAARITITEERAGKVLFSEPYCNGGLGLIVRAHARKE